MASLVGKNVLITGASSGIGAAAARAFAQAGADVALLARSREGLERVADDVRAQGSRALVLPADVTDQAALADAVARTEASSAASTSSPPTPATTAFGDFEDVAKEDFDRTVEIRRSRAGPTHPRRLPRLAPAREIVVTGSIMTKVPLPTFSSYAASKHALLGLATSCASSWRPAAAPSRSRWSTRPAWTRRCGRAPRPRAASCRAARPISTSPTSSPAPSSLCAARPRHDVHVGSEATLVVTGWTLARPVAELALTLVHRLYSSGTTPADGRGACGRAPARRQRQGLRRGRPSLSLPLRLALPRRCGVPGR